MPEDRRGALSRMNDSRTCTKIDAELTHGRYGLVHALDSAQRRERDPSRKLALCIRMAMEREGVPAAYKARQDAILKPRVRVQAVGLSH